MESKMLDLIAAADWTSLTPRLEHYAETKMRRLMWRGLRVTAGMNGQLLVDGKSADDFVTEAVDALLNGPRTYDNELSLERNLSRTIESNIWAWKKKSDRKLIVDHRPMTSEDGTEFDPIVAAVDPTSCHATEAEKNEKRALQNKLLDDFGASIQGDVDLTAVLEAYKADFTKPADIEELTGIPAARVSELKRKLESKMSKFVINHPSAAELE